MPTWSYQNILAITNNVYIQVENYGWNQDLEVYNCKNCEIVYPAITPTHRCTYGNIVNCLRW